MDPKVLDSYAAAFCILGALHLNPPDEGVVKDFLSMTDQWPLPLTSKGTQALADLRSELAANPSEEDIYTLWSDQNTLYGITGSAQLPPFESVHRCDDGLVFDDETVQVRRYYGAMGFQAPHLGQEPDDHIGLEMDFASKCLLKAADCFAGGDQEQGEQTMGVLCGFSGEHLLTWAPDFCLEGEKLAKTQWLRTVLILSGQTLSQWQQELVTAGYELKIALKVRPPQEVSSGPVPVPLTRRLPVEDS